MGRMKQSPVAVHIRWMIRRDMAEVLDIENESFEFPWQEEDFLRCLKQRNCIGMVAEQDDQVLGQLLLRLQVAVLLGQAHRVPERVTARPEKIAA